MPTFCGAQFMQPVKSIDGEPFKDFEQEFDGKIKEKGDLSMRQAIRIALNHTPDKTDDEKKLEYFAIITKIFSADKETAIDLSSSEIVMIENKCKQRWGTEAFGFIHNVLEGKNTDFKILSSETATK